LDAELSRRLTLAKQTPERAWLGEVSAVVLQQSLADLHRAYRNYFRAVAEVKAARARGEKAKLKARKPKFKSKRHDQAIRVTRAGRFHVLPSGRLRLPKIGDVRVRWSRPLPSRTKLGDGHAGRRWPVPRLVCRGGQPPAAPAGRSGGRRRPRPHGLRALSTGEKVANPRWLRQREKALRRSQRAMSRKHKGSKNREKARRRLASQHVRVADARRDFHQQLSTRLIRDNQAVYMETLNPVALGRSKLAKSVKDAGWGQFTAMLAEKADRYGRTLVKVDRWYPSSQLCSACGGQTGPKGSAGLNVRTWTCPTCNATHDRDVNAANNILAEGRSVAACGGSVRPGATLAVPGEAGTTLAGAA
jgi:IS605 OrfB family transposase